MLPDENKAFRIFCSGYAEPVKLKASQYTYEYIYFVEELYYLTKVINTFYLFLEE